MSFNENKRNAARLLRQPEDSWQLKVNDDELITKNIVNLSPTGISFKAPLRSNFESGQKLQFNVSLGPKEDFDCEGKVVWMRRVDDGPGSMQLLGVEFFKIPSWADSQIMREIHKRSLYQTERYEGPRIARKPEPSHFEIKSVLFALLSSILLASLIGTFLTVMYLRQQRYPADDSSLSSRLNKAFQTRQLQTQ